MINRKNSQYIFSILILAGIIGSVSYSFYISKHLKKKPPLRSKIWLLGKGDYFLDTMTYQYEHLVTDFPLLELHPREENIVQVEGYQNSKRFLTVKHTGDTLFVRQTYPDSDTLLVAVEGDYPIVVRIGAASLKSITVNNGGRIDIPVNPYGSNPGDEIVYKPQDWEKYVLRNEAIELNLFGSGQVELFLETNTLNLSNLNNYNDQSGNRMCSTFIGKVKKLNLIHPRGNVCILGNYLKVDSLIVKSDPNPPYGDSGFVQIQCSDYLDADLRYNMNVAYKGNPKIKRKEQSFGRVVNNN